MDPLQTDPTRSLSLAASDPMTFGGAFGTQSNTSDYAHNFGVALQGLLKQYQQLGTKPFQTQALNASDAQLNASNSQLINPNLQGYSPSTIMNAASAAEKPFNPIIQGAQNSAQTFSEQLKGFGSILDNAQNILDKQQQLQRQQQQDAQSLIHDAIATGSDAVSALLTSQPNIVKLAGYSPETLKGVITGLKKTEAQKSYSTYKSTLNNNPTNTQTTIVDPVTDAAVAQIIQNNPGEYGHAADAIDAQFGKGTATKYDSWLKDVYLNGQNINQIYQPEAFGGLSGINLSRVTSSANRIVSNYINSGTYKVVSEGAPYLGRIQTASNNPGSVSDAELLDSVTKLNTGGNQVTETQIRTITGGKSLSDTLNVLGNKLKNGGILSDNQRSQLKQLAQATYNKYLQDYTPIYNQATAQLKAAGIPQQYWTIPNWNVLVKQQSTDNSSNNDYQTYLNAINGK